MIAAIYITLGILYMLACIADGQDVKPIWKRWLGLKLADIADGFYPIDFCHRDTCKYYKGLRKAQKDVRELKHRLDVFQTARPIPVQQSYLALDKIESRMVISEGDVFRARCREHEAERIGMPKHMLPKWETVDGLVEETKRRCVDSILKAAETRITLEVEKERFYPEIAVLGTLYVGRKR